MTVDNRRYKVSQNKATISMKCVNNQINLNELNDSKKAFKIMTKKQFLSGKINDKNEYN